MSAAFHVAPDWASISRSFEYTMMGRLVDGPAEQYGQPLRYDGQQPAPSALHGKLSQLLWELRPLIYKRVEPPTAQEQARIAELEQWIEAVKRQLWLTRYPTGARPEAKAEPVKPAQPIQQKLF